MTSWYVIAMCLMLAAYASATFVAVRHEFFEQLDDQLHEDFESAEGLVALTPDGRTVWLAKGHHDTDDDIDRGVDVSSATGQLLLRSGSSATLPAVAVPATTAPRYESTQLNGHRWRTLTATTMVDGRAFVLRVARSEDHLRMQLSEILVVLGLGVPLIVGLAGIGGYVLARRALAPIDHLASEARRITADRLHERLSVVNEHDEIGRLASVINTTFARLESSFEQLRRFTADASHELRTPLAVLRGIGEAVLSQARAPAECQEAIVSMLEEVGRLTHLVDTLLRLSHGDAGTVRLNRENVDVGQLVGDVMASLTLLAEERNQHIAINVPERVNARVDRLVLREALTNVIDNAIKYSPRHSTIDVRVESTGDDAVVTVADQGPGIGVEHRERVFDRFYRMDEGRSRAQGGAGLGLAIAKWAVEANGGRISVERGTTGGAVFRILLPRTDASTERMHLEVATQLVGE